MLFSHRDMFIGVVGGGLAKAITGVVVCCFPAKACVMGTVGGGETMTITGVVVLCSPTRAFVVGTVGGGLFRAITGVAVCWSRTKTCVYWYGWWWVYQGQYWNSGVLFSHQDMFIGTVGGVLPKAMAGIVVCCDNTKTWFNWDCWGGLFSHQELRLI